MAAAVSIPPPFDDPEEPTPKRSRARSLFSFGRSLAGLGRNRRPAGLKPVPAITYAADTDKTEKCDGSSRSGSDVGSTSARSSVRSSPSATPTDPDVDAPLLPALDLDLGHGPGLGFGLGLGLDDGGGSSGDSGGSAFVPTVVVQPASVSVPVVSADKTAGRGVAGPPLPSRHPPLPSRPPPAAPVSTPARARFSLGTDPADRADSDDDDMGPATPTSPASSTSSTSPTSPTASTESIDSPDSTISPSLTDPASPASPIDGSSSQFSVPANTPTQSHFSAPPSPSSAPSSPLPPPPPPPPPPATAPRSGPSTPPVALTMASRSVSSTPLRQNRSARFGSMGRLFRRDGPSSTSDLPARARATEKKKSRARDGPTGPTDPAFRSLAIDFVRFEGKTRSAKVVMAQTLASTTLARLPGLPVPGRDLADRMSAATEIAARAAVLFRWWTGLLAVGLGTGPAVSNALAAVLDRPEWVALVRAQVILSTPTRSSGQFSSAHLRSSSNLADLPASETEPVRGHRRSRTSSFSSLRIGQPATAPPPTASSGTALAGAADVLAGSPVLGPALTQLQSLVGQTLELTASASAAGPRLYAASVARLAGKAAAVAFVIVPGTAATLGSVWASDGKGLVCEIGAVAAELPPEDSSLAAGLAVAAVALRTGPQLRRSVRRRPDMPTVFFTPGWRSRWTGRDGELPFCFARETHRFVRRITAGIPSSGRFPGFGLIQAGLMRAFWNAAEAAATATGGAPGMAAGMGIGFGTPLSLDRAESHLSAGLVVAVRAKEEGYVSFLETVVRLLAAVVDQSDPIRADAFCSLVERVVSLLSANGDSHLVWLGPSLCRLLAASRVTIVIRALDTLFNYWPTLVRTANGRRRLSLDVVLDTRIFAILIAHWNVEIRAHYIRLLVWRLCQVGDSAASDIDLEPGTRSSSDTVSVESDPAETLNARLCLLFARFLRLGPGPAATATLATLPALPNMRYRLALRRPDGSLLGSSRPVPLVKLIEASEPSLNVAAGTALPETNDDNSRPSTTSGKWSLFRRAGAEAAADTADDDDDDDDVSVVIEPTTQPPGAEYVFGSAFAPAATRPFRWSMERQDPPLVPTRLALHSPMGPTFPLAPQNGAVGVNNQGSTPGTGHKTGAAGGNQTYRHLAPMLPTPTADYLRRRGLYHDPLSFVEFAGAAGGPAGRSQSKESVDSKASTVDSIIDGADRHPDHTRMAGRLADRPGRSDSDHGAAMVADKLLGKALAEWAVAIREWTTFWREVSGAGATGVNNLTGRCAVVPILGR